MKNYMKTTGILHGSTLPFGLLRVIAWLYGTFEKLYRRFAPPHEVVMQLCGSYWYTPALYVAAKLRIADMLKDGPCTIDHLAATSKTDCVSLHRLMRTLASIGIFAEHENDVFSLTPMASSLRTDVPHSIWAVVIMYGEEWTWKPWGHLLYSVQTGRPSFEFLYEKRFFDFLDKNRDAEAIYHEAMTILTGRIAHEIAVAYPFPPSGILVDVAGGQGILTAAILKRYPCMKAILFDKSSTIETSRQLIDTEGVSNRCTIIGGDLFASIPEGGDCYLLKNIIHNWDDVHALRILRNCAHAMPPDGKLLLAEMVVPSVIASFDNKPSLNLDLEMMVKYHGARERTEDEFRTLLSSAGFTLQRVIPLFSTFGIIEAVCQERGEAGVSHE